MQRRQALQTFAALAGAGLLSRSEVRGDEDPLADLPLPALMEKIAPAFSSVPVLVAPLGGNLSLITGPGGNIAALNGPDGMLLVDSFVPQRSADLLKAVAATPVTMLVNTHWHFDHTGGNAALGGAGARIMAHENVRKRLGSDQFIVDFQMKAPASPPVALPVVSFGPTATLFVNGEEIALEHVPPAHTDGDMFLHFRKANVLHTGDLFSNGFYPNIDSSSEGWIGGMVAAADRILEVADAKTRIIPGHGPLGNREDLKAARDMLAKVQEILTPMVAAGKTLDEVIAAKPTKSLDEKWAKGFFKGRHFTQVAYSGLVKHMTKKA